MKDLSRMTLKEATECSIALRGLGAEVSSMEEAATQLVRFFYEELGGPGGDSRACVMVRFYKTHPYSGLEPDLQEFARGLMGGEPQSASVKCLTLLATVGDEPQWNSRRSSSGHQAIPLPSPEGIGRLPMVAQLINQLGVPVTAIVAPDEGLLLDLHQKTFNVFFVPVAPGSPYIPAQDDFVIPYGVNSVLGLGGLLPGGELFAIILFSRTPITRETADLFKPLALSAKLALLRCAEAPVFAETSDTNGGRE